MPSASENASAIAIVKTPPITASLEEVLTAKPIIKPRVVITPDVKPKLIPAFMAFIDILYAIDDEVVIYWRPGRESNPRIRVLQTLALPLGYHARFGGTRAPVLACWLAP